MLTTGDFGLLSWRKRGLCSSRMLHSINW